MVVQIRIHLLHTRADFFGLRVHSIELRPLTGGVVLTAIIAVA